MSTGRTPDSKKTRFGKVPDFERASNELTEESLGNLVKDIAEYQGTPYETSQDVARAFHAEEAERYNQNQLEIRETAKANVDKFDQPDWAWDLLSVYSEDFGKKLLDIPSDGSNKGLIVDEDMEKAFLYSKKADGTPAIEHVRTWYDNAVNAQSVGYNLPSDKVERSCLNLEGTVEPVLEMDYNGEMILDSQIEDYVEEEIGKDMEEELDQRLERWLKDSDPSSREMKYNEEEIEEWQVGLELLVDQGYIETWGIGEFRYGRDNTAVDPETLDRILVDVGEITEEEEKGSQEDYEPSISGDSGHSISPDPDQDDSSWAY